VPWAAGHGGAQDVHDVEAVLAGGVGVAADVEPVLGGGLAGEPSGDLLLGLEGPDAALADVVQANRRLRVIGAVRRQRAGCG